MGKGDIKTKRGKIRNGSYGVRRNRRDESVIPVAVKVAEPEKAPAAKPKKRKVAEPAEMV